MTRIVVCLSFCYVAYGFLFTHTLRGMRSINRYQHSNTGGDELSDLMREVQKLLHSVQPLSKELEYSRSKDVTAGRKMQPEAQIHLTEEIRFNPAVELPSLAVNRYAPKLFSKEMTPSIVITGCGKVGQNVNTLAEQNKWNFIIKTLDSQELTAMSDAQLRALTRGVKSVVIADDPEVVAERGIFGRTKYTEKTSSLGGSVLKKLLSAVSASQTQSQREEKEATVLKVVYLSRACKPPRSAASLLFGDTTALEDEVVLQCRQHGFDYAIVKVGRIIELNEPIPHGVPYRGADGASLANIAQVNPIDITLAAGIQHDECTRVEVAAEGLLRAVNHPGQNCSFSLLSNPWSPITDVPAGLSENRSSAPTEADWADAFLVLDGPELLRIPLIHASMSSVLQRLHSLAFSIERHASATVSAAPRENTAATVGAAVTKELVTPVVVERCANGVQFAFKPVASRSAASFRQDKIAAKEHSKKDASPRRDAAAGEEGGPGDSASTKEIPERSAGRGALQGGLEILVEETPYARVRVRRCLMGKQTVVKEESERVLLRAVERCVALLELEASSR